MKILRNSLMIVALFSVTLFFSSFTQSNNDNGNGNIVTIDNGQTWWWAPDDTSCGDAWVPSTSARVQSATKGFWSLTVTFQLPEGHCDIPEKGARVTHYDSNSWSIINSKGVVKGKIIFRPNN